MLLDLVQNLEHLGLRLAGFQRRWVTTGAGRLHAYVRPGSPEHPPLVVLHGIASRAVELRPLLTRLSRFPGTVVAPDLPGHGSSDVPPGGLTPSSLEAGVLEGLDALLDAPGLLFGNSLGGLAVLRYALARPEKVRALGLCSPGGAPMPEDAFRAWLGRFHLPSRREAAAFVDRIHAAPPWYRHLIAGTVRARLRGPTLAPFLEALRSEDLLDAASVGSLQVPAWLLWGQRDALMLPEHLGFFREHLPRGTRVEEPSNMGHCPHLDTPRDLAERVLAWASS